MAARVWRPAWPCDPYDIVRAVRRGAGDPAFQRDPGGDVWRAAMTPEGAATLRISVRPTAAEITLEAWGRGAAWMLEQAPAMLGAVDDVGDFAASHPRVAVEWSRSPHWRVSQTGLVLEALVAAVIEQKVTGQEAWTGWRRLLSRFGEEAPGQGAERGMRCLPTADVLARIPSWEWLRCHIDGARASTIVRAARVAGSLERTIGLPATEVERRLRSLPGVGVWTAAEVRQRAHGDADAVSFADYHVARHVGWALCGEDIDDERLAELLEPDRPHRYRVQHIVTTRMRGRPRRGPRMPPRRHLPR
ncbi:MAG: DNA-3-methyladenine glycosylase 2 family protein [Nocardioidaceae bacterium]|nr:DNA-3-methyladenine glycosylase 2 family protein [Nocardioidaceae bacterium]